MITATTTVTSSIVDSVYASRENKGLGFIVIAKGNEGTAVVIESQFENRRAVHFRYGYLRFGARKPIWVGATMLGPGTSIEKMIAAVVEAANATEFARRAA